MRTQDKKIMLEAARHFNVWILVRRTNPRSLEYVGQPGYTPKQIDCKAKTASRDVTPYRLAGLVIDPTIHPGAFYPDKTPAVLRCWAAMQPVLGTRYTVNTDSKSKHYGCLQVNGAFIHGDYDLYDIIDVTQMQRNLAAVETLLGQAHRRGPKLIPVQEFVNSRIGSPMIRHGGEAQYADHSEQSIDAFGPNGEDVTILNEFSVRSWYRDRFQGRKTLG